MCSFTLVCCALWKGDFVCAVRSLGCLLSNSFESQSHRQYRLRVKTGFSFVFRLSQLNQRILYFRNKHKDLCISKYFRKPLENQPWWSDFTPIILTLFTWSGKLGILRRSLFTNHMAYVSMQLIHSFFVFSFVPFTPKGIKTDRTFFWIFCYLFPFSAKSLINWPCASLQFNSMGIKKV